MGSGTRLLSRIIFLLVGLFLLAAPALASPGALRLRQVHLDYPSLTAFADLLDDEGKRLAPGGEGVFAAALGGRQLKVSEVRPYSASDDGLLTVLLVDISSSTGQGRFEGLREALAAWIRKLGPLDPAAGVSVGEEVRVVQGFTGEKNALLYALQSLSPGDASTQLNLGIIKALDLARGGGRELPARRLILLCSDGFRESTGGATPEEVRAAIQSGAIPVFSVLFDSPERDSKNRNIAAQQLLNELGFDAGPVDGKTGPRTAAAIRVFQQSRGVAWDGMVSNELVGVLRELAGRRKEASTAWIGEISRRSGGQVHRVDSGPLPAALDAISSSLEDAVAIRVDLEGVEPDGTLKRLEISFTDGSRSLSDGVECRLTAPRPADPQVVESAEHAVGAPGGFAWWYAGAAFAVLILPVGVALVRRRAGRVTAGAPLDEPTVMLFPKGEKTGRIVPPVAVELALSGRGDGRSVLKGVVAERLVLGRTGAPSVLVVPGDATISARHCELKNLDGRLSVRDLGSSNGTMVNGVPIDGEYPLEDGDRLMLGKTEMRVRIRFEKRG